MENRLPHFHHQCNGPVLHFSEILLTGMNASEILNLVQKAYQLKSKIFSVLGLSGVMFLHLDLSNDTDHTFNHDHLYNRYK